MPFKFRFIGLREGYHSFTCESDPKSLNLPEETFKQVVSAEIELNKRESLSTVEFKLTTAYDGVCDDCLVDFEDVLNVEFSAFVTQNPEEAQEDDALFIHTGTNEVDFSELAHDHLLLNLPLKKLCRSDCKGLCDRCGQNLNDGRCNCKQEDRGPLWSQLQKLSQE